MRRGSARKCSCASACAAPEKASVERFTREIVPLVLNGPPSVTGFAGGRPKAEEIVAYWPALIDKTVVQTRGRGDRMKVRLLDIAHARSGDKGDTANVGLIALNPELVSAARAVRDARARRARTFEGMITGGVERYELPNLRRAELPAAWRARRRRDVVAQDRCAGEGVFDGAAAARARDP